MECSLPKQLQGSTKNTFLLLRSTNCHKFQPGEWIFMIHISGLIYDPEHIVLPAISGGPYFNYAQPRLIVTSFEPIYPYRIANFKRIKFYFYRSPVGAVTVCTCNIRLTSFNDNGSRVYWQGTFRGRSPRSRSEP